MSTPLDERLYPPLVWATSVSFIALGCALLLLMLAAVIGPFRFGDLSEAEAEAAIGIWVQERVAGFLPGATRRRVEAWTELAGEDSPVLQTPRLADLKRAGVRLVVLPDARQLGDEDLAELLEFVRDGGSAILTGSVGVRFRDGRWRGYETMEQLLELPDVRPLDLSAAVALRASERGPLSGPLAARERVALKVEDGMPGAINPDAELRWPHALDPNGVPLAASQRLDLGSGRLIWIAAGPEHVFDAIESERRALLTIFEAAIAWAQHKPTLEVRSWPAGAAFVASIAFEAGDSGHDPAQQRADLELAAREGGDVQILLTTGRRGEEQAERWRGELHERGAWIATPEQQEAWLAARASVRTLLQRVGPHRFLVRVSNLGPQPVDQLALALRFNRPVVAVAIDRTTLLQEVPSLQHRPGEESAGLILPAIPAGESRAYHVDFELPLPSEQRFAAAGSDSGEVPGRR